MRALGFIHRLILAAALLLNGGAPLSAYEMPSAGQKVAEQKVSPVESPCPKHTHNSAHNADAHGNPVLADDTSSSNEERPRPPTNTSPTPRPDNNNNNKPARQPCCLSGACAHTCFTTVGLTSQPPSFTVNRVPTEVAHAVATSVRSVSAPPLTRPPIR